MLLSGSSTVFQKFISMCFSVDAIIKVTDTTPQVDDDVPLFGSLVPRASSFWLYEERQRTWHIFSPA